MNHTNYSKKSIFTDIARLKIHLILFPHTNYSKKSLATAVS
jgi:hypothetical protein